jgi:hypothetical protein
MKKNLVTIGITALMLLGTFSAIAMPKHSKSNATLASDGGPAPLCRPGDPNCQPPIPTAR